MSKEAIETGKKHLCVGLLAHVDAGKTTVCEQILFQAGVIRNPGRVDHGNTFMDNEALEQQRGITIFSEQASLVYRCETGKSENESEQETEIILIDTPGHADFAPQRRRTLGILDVCVLILSGTDGVQSGTKEIYEELVEAGIPVVFFVNKMDLQGADPAKVDEEIRALGAVPVSPDLTDEETREEIALLDDTLLEKHLDGSAVAENYEQVLRKAIKERSVSLRLRGSALLGNGIKELLQTLTQMYEPRFTLDAEAPFSAKVYKVRRNGGQRLVYARVMSGNVSVKTEVETANGIQKVHSLYHAEGKKLNVVSECQAGDIAVLGNFLAMPGEIIGAGACVAERPEPMLLQALEPIAPLILEKLLQDLRELEEEEPELSVRPAESSVQVGLMGKTQQEVLVQLLEDRYQDSVVAGEPEIQYRETISTPVTGIGHYEPLRHYAEVWLTMLPGKPGSGITFRTACPPNQLDENWKRLIRTHIFETTHPGVLTGSPITDIEIILVGGRSHLKHTEGGDFREATCRAIRQGLMQAKSVLLEPVVYFECVVPSDCSSRVTGDLLGMEATLDMPELLSEGQVRQTGICRLSTFYPYPERFASVTHGNGRMSSHFHGYAPCKNADEVIAKRGYEPTADPRHPCNSVFCSHGAGFPVAWDKVKDWAHLREEMEDHPDVYIER